MEKSAVLRVERLTRDQVVSWDQGFSLVWEREVLLLLLMLAGLGKGPGVGI